MIARIIRWHREREREHNLRKAWRDLEASRQRILASFKHQDFTKRRAAALRGMGKA